MRQEWRALPPTKPTWSGPTFIANYFFNSKKMRVNMSADRGAGARPFHFVLAIQGAGSPCTFAYVQHM